MYICIYCFNSISYSYLIIIVFYDLMPIDKSLDIIKFKFI